MSILSTIFGGGVGEAVKSIGTVLDETMLSNEEKATIQKEIILAELAQDDRYTKRMRPTIGYAGLVIIFWNYGIAPHFGLNIIEFPEAFWWAWGGVVGVYAVGRSMEKMGVKVGVTQ